LNPFPHPPPLRNVTQHASSCESHRDDQLRCRNASGKRLAHSRGTRSRRRADFTTPPPHHHPRESGGGGIKLPVTSVPRDNRLAPSLPPCGQVKMDSQLHVATFRSWWIGERGRRRHELSPNAPDDGVTIQVHAEHGQRIRFVGGCGSDQPATPKNAATTDRMTAPPESADADGPDRATQTHSS